MAHYEPKPKSGWPRFVFLTQTTFFFELDITFYFIYIYIFSKHMKADWSNDSVV